MSLLFPGGRLIGALAIAATPLALAELAPSSAMVAEATGDITIVARPWGETVYVIDPARRGLFAFDWREEQATVMAFDEFRPVGARDLRSPTALAARGDSIIATDADALAVVEVDARSGTQRLLYAGPPLKRPTGVAVSSGGDVAVADPVAGAVFLLPREGKDLKVDRSFEAPVRVRFDGEDLVVLDRSRGVLRGRVGGKWASVFPRQLAAVRDVAPYRGVYYVAEEGRLAAVAPGASPIPIPAVGLERARFERVALTSRAVVAADLQRRIVTRVRRPVPVTFRWSPAAGEETTSANERDRATRALAASYAYLARLDMLPRIEITAARPAPRLDDWLVEQRVLVWPVGDGAGGGRVGADPSAFEPFRRLLCDDNGRSCVGGEADLARPVAARERLTVPGVNLTTFVATSEVTLAGRRADQHIAERVATPDQRRQFTLADLASLNLDDRTASLEMQMTRRRLVLATPASPALAVGALLSMTPDGRDAVGDDLAARCGMAPGSIKAERLTLPKLLRTTAVNEYLPARGAEPIRAPRTEATSLELELEAPRLERVGTDAYDGLRKLAGASCLVASDTPPFVVTQALKASAARYRLLRGAEVVAVSERELRSWGLAGVPDPTKTWSFVVEQPLTIAYQAVAVRALETASELASPLDAARLKPSSPQNLFTRTQGTLVLPVTAWRYDALVPATEIEGPESDLHKLEEAHPGLSIPSSYTLPTRTASPPPESCGTPAVTTADDIRDRIAPSRKALLGVIGFDPELVRGTVETIGIAEKGTSVDFDHPGFINSDGRSAWLERVDAVRLEPREPRVASPLPPVRLRPLELVGDHGTHVAGLLAAQPASLSEGLVPESSLLLIDADEASERSLVEAIGDAVGRGVHIFNFSLELEGSGEPLDALKSRLLRTWSRQLFVAAAGNSGKDLHAEMANPLVLWAPEVPNIIGVGSASEDGLQILGAWHEGDDIRQGSNFGSRYVHVIAPGRTVYSLARANSYACATGSSQAAPQVTAAAAALFTRGVIDPLLIKARLIYTADWLPQFDGKVLGGRLNVRRALFEPLRNVYEAHTPGVPPFALKLAGAPAVTVTNGDIEEPDGSIVAAPAQINFQNVLSLTHISGSRYRALVLHNGRLRVLKGELSGRIGCHTLEQWNPAAANFTQKDDVRDRLKATCRTGIDVAQMKRYVARVPPEVKY
jgi:hypothetical protein